MPRMGRRRKDQASGLEPRMYEKHGAFYYVHRDGRWEHLGADYRSAIEPGTRNDGQASMQGALATYFKPPMTPLDVTPNQVKRFLQLGADAGRAVPANREKACFSAFMSWLILTGEVPGLRYRVIIEPNMVVTA